MRVLNLLGLLLLATRPTRSVTTEPRQGWDEPLCSGQANAATRIASSTSSDTALPSQEFDDEIRELHFPVLEYSALESHWLQGNSLFQYPSCRPFNEISLLNEWDSSPGSKLDASHISIDSQQLIQEGENIHCLIDSNQIPIDSEKLSSNGFRENLLPTNRNMLPSQEWAMLHDETQKLHFPEFEYSTWESNLLQGNSLLEFDYSTINLVDQFDESSSMNEWGSRPGLKIDASHISLNSQQLSQEGEKLDCLIDPNRRFFDSEVLPSKDFLENLVPSNRNALQDWNPSTSSERDASRISIDGQQSIESVDGKTFDSRIETTTNSKNQPVDVRENFVLDGFSKHTKKRVHFRNANYLLGLRMLCPLLNWNLDEVKDKDSLCVFLGKERSPEQVDYHDSVAMTEHIMELLLHEKSGRDNVEVGESKVDVPDPRIIAKATSTLQKLILISNFVLKLLSCRKSRCSISSKVIICFKRTCIPVLHCLVKCCDKDMDLFQTRWGARFKHRYFGVKCCPGGGSYHNTCGFQMTKIVRNPDYRDKDFGLLDLKDLVVAVSTSKTAEEKLNLCWKFNEKYRSSGIIARNHLRTYYNQTPKPIWGCFVHHCGHQINEWIRKWGFQFAHADFSMRKCHGSESHRCGSIPPFDIPARHKLRNSSIQDLLPALSKILEEYDQFVIAKTTLQRSPHPALTKMITKSRPVYDCLHRHCAGSVEEFIRRWGKSVHYSKFSRDCCPGKGRKGLISVNIIIGHAKVG